MSDFALFLIVASKNHLWQKNLFQFPRIILRIQFCLELNYLPPIAKFANGQGLRNFLLKSFCSSHMLDTLSG